MDKSQHNPHLLGQIRHPSMPQPQIPQDNTSLADIRLARRANFPAVREEVFFDAAAGSVPVSSFLDFQTGPGARMGSEPELCAAVLRCEVYEGDVDY